MSATTVAVVTEVEIAQPAAPPARFVPLTRDDLLQYEAAVAQMALDEAEIQDAEPVLVRFRGRTIAARPLDLRRFIRAMAPHVSMN